MHLTASSHTPATGPNGATMVLPPAYKWCVCFFNYADWQASDAIAFGGVIYLAAALSVLAGMLLFARRTGKLRTL